MQQSSIWLFYINGNIKVVPLPYAPASNYTGKLRTQWPLSMRPFQEGYISYFLFCLWCKHQPGLYIVYFLWPVTVFWCLFYCHVRNVLSGKLNYQMPPKGMKKICHNGGLVSQWNQNRGEVENQSVNTKFYVSLETNKENSYTVKCCRLSDLPFVPHTLTRHLTGSQLEICRICSLSTSIAQI